MQESNLIDPNLIEINIGSQTKEDVIKEMATILINNGYVKETYLKAILEREKVFPTGLYTESLGVAIPHADIEHVIKPAIAVATLKNPVKFNVMENPENEIDIKIVFMLAITDPKMQVNVLKNLVSLFQNKELLIRLSEIDNKQSMSLLLAETLNFNINNKCI
ncbi:MAG: PTS sugar transporter subunit IIA [Thermoanaerobacteraceae bacterium]|nr:PTS sugar transporter subunit IIA [Thermoanaerobacteraceae bacterium]